MKIVGAAAVVGVMWLGAGSLAAASPTTRFGLTMAASDDSAPGAHELGPTIAVGERMGAFTVEADYAYLSFMDAQTATTAMQRLGANLRADVYRVTADHCRQMYACTRGSAIYAEAGIAERYGQWQLDATTKSPTDTDRTHEVHVGVGIELDNRLAPTRYGWQLGVRLAFMSRPDTEDPTCRSSSCSTMSTSATSSTEKAVFVEWTFVVGG